MSTEHAGRFASLESMRSLAIFHGYASSLTSVRSLYRFMWLASTALSHIVGVPQVAVPQGREPLMTAPLSGLLLVCLYVGLVLLVSGFTYSRIEAPFRSMSRTHAPRFGSLSVKSTTA